MHNARSRRRAFPSKPELRFGRAALLGIDALDDRKPPDDEFIDLETFDVRVANGQPADRERADGKCADRRSADRPGSDDRCPERTHHEAPFPFHRGLCVST